MPETDPTNTIFDHAATVVNNTPHSVFLTGKAGTGKTTFLRYICENTQKKAVVVAPTGVAAINAGGVTIHSFFQLPFGPFIPDDPDRLILLSENDQANNSANLLKKIRLSTKKKELMRSLELLIIDEISMVRPDVLDAMDAVLRFVRRNPFQPFGGVQVLYLGDLFQLPPVMPDDHWELLRHHYESWFFFEARAIRQAPPRYIELQKIYRQNDPLFIEVLNRVRNNSVSYDDLQMLNQRFRPSFKSTAEDPYIVLTSHNRKAEVINAEELQALPGTIHRFPAEVSGDFPERDRPTDSLLCLKEGAQIMFVRNDPERRYYNGKIGRVSRIEGDEIYVRMEEADTELMVSREKWRNIRYVFNEAKDRIEEEELGSFVQYPIRLAWAITIHKSQGLTFKKAIIDAGSSFAPGQVYVALSRCTSLDGIVLGSPIGRHCIKTAEEVIAFSRQALGKEEQGLQQRSDKQPAQ